jgi:S1-C subfamily serine protease
LGSVVAFVVESLPDTAVALAALRVEESRPGVVEAPAAGSHAGLHQMIFVAVLSSFALGSAAQAGIYWVFQHEIDVESENHIHTDAGLRR